MHGPTLLTTTNGRSITSRTFAQFCHKVYIGFNGTPHIHPQKLSLHVGQFPTLTTCQVLGPSRPTTLNGIQIQSTVFPQYTGESDIDGQTYQQMV